MHRSFVVRRSQGAGGRGCRCHVLRIDVCGFQYERGAIDIVQCMECYRGGLWSVRSGLDHIDKVDKAIRGTKKGLAASKLNIDILTGLLHLGMICDRDLSLLM